MRQMRITEIAAILVAAVILVPGPSRARDKTEQIAVGAQYGTAHVCVAEAHMDRFAASFLATFGGYPTGLWQMILLWTMAGAETAIFMAPRILPLARRLARLLFSQTVSREPAG